ncbi:MAG TPA: hypothetical protein VH601_25890 [Bryobacteraceae bacterium]|jgi:hypothetical protein
MTTDGAGLTGSLRALLLFDVAEQIDLSRLHSILGTTPSKREPAFRHPSPEYVRYERPPVVDNIGVCETSEGQILETRIRYFDYGVASVELQSRFGAGWPDLVQLANRWISSPALEVRVSSLLRERLHQLKAALIKAHEAWISEDYYVIQINPIALDDGRLLPAEDLIRERGPQIAQIVRGEESLLSSSETQEILQSSMSYYPVDLLVVGWVAAFIYDTQHGAAPTIDLLEYANTQLLEFRYYDEVLTRVLSDVYNRLGKKRSVWARWRLARHAEDLNTIRLDYRELSEHTDNAIKFLSDMFYARAYRLAAARIGVNDYRDLVTEKLSTARDLYESMINEFHQSRAFLLELMVVIILVIEIVFLFRGKG